jgi:hypothetical protein
LIIEERIAIGCALVGKPLEMELHVLVQQLVLRQQLRKPLQLPAGGQMPVNDQIGRLDKRRFLRQFLDRYAPIPQNPLLAVDERDRAPARPVFE